MKFLGIEIERKTDILAMAAFLISIGSIIGQFALLIRGAEIVLDGPRQVVLLFEEPMGGRGYLNAISSHIYVNKGTPGYDDILKSETLLLQLKGHHLELKAQESVSSTASGDKLILKQRAQWKPEKIKAGDFISSETLFVPYPSHGQLKRDANFVDVKQFKSFLATANELKVVLKVKTYGGRRIIAECYLVSRDVLAGIQSKGWSSLECDKKTTAWTSYISSIFRHGN
jgi:hypothetical protein